MGAHIQLDQQTMDMMNWILLDNQSSVSVFCNNEWVTNIRKSKEGNMHLATHRRILLTSKGADLPQWGEVWFDEKVIINICSYAEMAYMCRII
jgi:hypothetical protein